ncbi:MAG: glycoside hydrolase family 3 C-terminal domain-containing protein [Solirubrobacterales bacterium]|nr:glycoside hydrolase family 3 C-terminal domain-containing protein [Solirubrobacterales bacterium]
MGFSSSRVGTSPRAISIRLLAIAAVVVTSLLTAATAGASGPCGDSPWCDSSLSPAKRASLLLSAMTPEQRIGLLAGDHAALAGADGTHTGAADGIPALGVPDFFQTDGPMGVRQGKATSMPSEMSLASSFDRNLARSYGALVGNEAKLKGNDLVYAPTVNILRTPLWGRAFESMGEDPFLTSSLAVDYIRGMQSEGVIANVKHFAVNNQEGNAQGGSRFSVSAQVDDRTLREIYLPAFEAAVKRGDVGSVMCSYNKINGVHGCENPTLLTQILREEWGFKGLVLADYGASKHIDTGLRAGLDYEPFPFVDFDGGENLTPAQVTAALQAGRINQGDIDTAVRHQLETLFRFGFFDRTPFVDDPSRINNGAHQKRARRAAEQGTVLLQNDGVLPLNSKRLGSLAVIGADATRYVNGGGSSDIDPLEFTSVLGGIQARAGKGVDVSFDPGNDLEQAAQAARGADAAVVVIADASSEGSDKPCLGIDCGAEPIDGMTIQRDALVEQVAAANPNTIVLLETAGPVLTPWRDQVAAVVEGWYPGGAAGSALARVLFGDVDPGGRLPATFPDTEAQLPTSGNPSSYPGVDNVADYSEGVLVGYRWFDKKGLKPAYPFGHGLSYSRFAFRGLKVRPDRRGAGARVSLKVANVGDRKGIAVPQLYVKMPGTAKRVQPPRQLKAFKSVKLKPGASRLVRFHLGSRAFSYWSDRRSGWDVAKGCYRIEVGKSSRSLGRGAKLAWSSASGEMRRGCGS